MADMYGAHFEFGGISSRKYGLIIANVETTRMLNTMGNISGIFVANRRNNRRYIIADDYSNFPLSYELEIITDDQRGIEYSTRREIEKWLFNRHSFRKFYIDTDDDCFGETWDMVDGEYKRLFLRCRFINPRRLEYNNGIVGYAVTLEADSGAWWQDETVVSIDIDNESASSTSTFTVVADSDIDDYIYPEVTITIGETGGDIVLINGTDSSTRLTKFSDLTSEIQLQLKGEINYVNGQNYLKFANKNFPRLLDGENTFSIQGDVTNITFKYNNRRAL